MKAAVLRGVEDLRLEDVARRDPVRDEVLVKVKRCGVCGTDVHMWHGTNFEGVFPFIPGHEWMGVVEAVGPKVKALKVGDRVTSEPFIPDRLCYLCKNGSPSFACPNHLYYGFTWDTPGGMAEYNVSPEEHFSKIPDTLSDDEGALVEPVSVAYHAVWGSGGGAGPHDRIAVCGTGPIGLLALQICKVSGAQVIAIEPGAYRAKMALSFGAEAVIDPVKENLAERAMDLTDGLGFTLIVECSGNPTAIASTVDVVAVGGRIVLTGQSIGTKVSSELGKIIWKDAKIIGSCDAPHFFPKTIQYIARHLADTTKVITHHYPLKDAGAAFEMSLKGTESGKVMLDIQ
jgi:L-iditol 2-dehydrogenase